MLLESTMMTNPASEIPHSILEQKSEDRYIIQSPYIEPEHRLDMWDLDHANTIVTRALANLTCLRDDYATAAYTDIFNWSEVMDDVRQRMQESGKPFEKTSFYIVVFRSQIPPTTAFEDLGVLDKAAHAEAVASGGFLKYVYREIHIISGSGKIQAHKLGVTGTGSGRLMPRGGIWPPAYGDPGTTL